MTALLASLLLAQAPCLSAAGLTRCAATPAGTCLSSYGEVVCADPPRIVFRVTPTPPKVECVAAYGRIACGYHCVASYGEVACAETPWGVCKASYGQVRCADPSPEAFDFGEPPPMDCLASGGLIACGYHCVASGGLVKCASSPAAQCLASGGQITCGGEQPEPRPHHHHHRR